MNRTYRIKILKSIEFASKILFILPILLKFSFDLWTISPTNKERSTF